MHDYVDYMESVNFNLDELGLQRLHNFMFAKNIIGIDLNIINEPIFICKAPSHVIKTQSASPEFEIYGYYEKESLIALMIKIYDLKRAPFIIFSYITAPAEEVELSNIQTLAFINEGNENILGVQTTHPFDLEKENIGSSRGKNPNDLINLKNKHGVTCRLLTKAKSTLPHEHRVHRDSDQHPVHAYKLADDISNKGEDTISGHGKRFEDLTHFYSKAIGGMNSFCGVKYAMRPEKSKAPSEELCDELIIGSEWALFIQEKSIITKMRFRENATVSERVETTAKRVKQAAKQLLKHIESVKQQYHSIHTQHGNMLIPEKILGLVLVPEIFHNADFFNACKTISNSDPLFAKIKLNVMSLEDYVWMVTLSEGNPEFIRRTLETMYSERISRGMIGNLPCNFSLSTRIG